MKLPLMVYLTNLIGFNFPKKPVNAATNMEKALRILIARDCITVRDILRFTNDGTKIIHQLRQRGYLHPLGTGEVWLENAAGNGRYKQYLWTGKMPAGWVKTDAYTGIERRSVVRGGCR
jgi:hypothetical protein